MERPSVSEAKAIECTIKCKKNLPFETRTQNKLTTPEGSGSPDSQRRDKRDPTAPYSRHQGRVGTGGGGGDGMAPTTARHFGTAMGKGATVFGTAKRLGRLLMPWLDNLLMPLLLWLGSGELLPLKLDLRLPLQLGLGTSAGSSAEQSPLPTASKLQPCKSNQTLLLACPHDTHMQTLQNLKKKRYSRQT